MGRLIHIELENFKSYRGQQTIGPFHSFTSVIGPNGSGKSNIMDAISFVLGVHSSHLRSQNLKDLIYRPEVESSQAPNEAQVSAIYEDNQHNQMRFTRTVNYHGHSEYRIDDVVVQYARYNKALEKENILVKAMNFLVFQGDVESVASQSPKDLTNLLEHISGSQEYRNRYDDLKRKYEQEMDNYAHCFHKKKSIASEIKQYEEQKADIEKFEQLVTDKQNLVIQYLLWKLFHNEAKTNELTEKLYKKDADKNHLQKNVVDLEENFLKAREEKALIHREKVKCELNIRRIKKTLDNQLPMSIGYKEKIHLLERKLKQTKQMIDTVNRDGQSQQKVVRELESSFKLLEDEEKQFEDSILSLKSDRFSLTNEQLLEYERRKQIVSLRAVEEQQLLQQYQRQLRTEMQTAEGKKFNLDRLYEEESQVKEKLSQVSKEKDKVSLEADILTEKLNERQRVLRELEHERITIFQYETELNEKLEDTLNKLMEFNVNQYESEKDAKLNESIIALKQIYPDVHGRLADFCRPTQRKYDVAIATVLGKYMDAIIVENEQTAFDCIQYLREQHVGTATFLPIHDLSLPPIYDKYRDLVHNSRLAFDTLLFDKKYRDVVQYACGNTLICDDLNIAKEICYNMDEHVKVVTLDGVIIHQSGLITGGSRITKDTQRWLHADIQEMMQRRDAYMNELNTISKNKRMGSAEDLARNDCADLRNQLDVLHEQWETLKRLQESHERTLQDICRKLEEATRPYEQYTLLLDQLTTQIKKVESDIQHIEDYVFEDFCAIINVPNIREFERVHYGETDEVRERHAQFSAQKSRFESQLVFERQQLHDLAVRLEQLKTTFANESLAKSNLEEELNSMSSASEIWKTELASYQANLEKHVQAEEKQQAVIHQISCDLQARGRDVEEVLRACRVVESERNKLSAERAFIFRKCKLEGIQLPLSRGSMDDIRIEEEIGDSSFISDDMEVDISQLSIETADWAIEVDFAQLGQAQRENGSLDMDHQFKEKLKQLSDDIEQLSPNLKAVDRLEGVTERLKVAEQEFKQARLFTKAAKDQFQVIKQKRCALFYEAFHQISEEIDTVYKDLTKCSVFPLGGTAYLSMEDSDEPYLSGIKYHAIPPMKRFADMEVLSGGEKSVAALALLFAIHGYKKSPFFVLDEVDAALDSTNISAVASYIREHASQDTQFIVISLKSTFYEKAQSLIGTYRDREMNSSKVLTLMLDE